MNKQIEALKLALETLEQLDGIDTETECVTIDVGDVIDAIKEALAQPKQEQKYRRGDRLICLETEEYAVIHISGTDRQWIKFTDSHIGVYTNVQVADLFELLPAQQEPVGKLQEPTAERSWFTIAEFNELANKYLAENTNCVMPTEEPEREWVGLTDEEITELHHEIKVRLMGTFDTKDIYRAVEQALKEKNT